MKDKDGVICRRLISDKNFDPERMCKVPDNPISLKFEIWLENFFEKKGKGVDTIG